MGLTKRLLSMSAIAASIAVLSVLQVIYTFQSIHDSPNLNLNEASQLVAEFTSIDLSSYSKAAPTSLNQDRRRTTTIRQEDKNLERVNNLPSTTSATTSSAEPEVKLLLSRKELEWVKRRGKLFDRWYHDNAVIIHRNSHPIVRKQIVVKVPDSTPAAATTRQSKTPPTPADFAVGTAESSQQAITTARDSQEIEVKPKHIDGEGPWLDFVIVGNPKCGTSTLMANLGHLAPMPVKDVCAGPGKTLKLAYQEWPTVYGGNLTQSIVDNDTLLRGSKCPRHLNDWMIKAFAANFQKTKFIIGIRHPVLWFNSFWRMMMGGDPYRMMEPCPCLIDERTGKRSCPGQADAKCFAECPDNQVFCLHRSRMHLPLARLGKTSLTEEERTWLAPQDSDGGHRLHGWNISNPIFLYDQTQMKEESYWEELADFLRVSYIPHTRYHGSKGKEQSHKSLCDRQFDAFRSVMMPYSYEMSVWLQVYLVPIARNPARKDVIIPNIDQFVHLVESYKDDPCNRLIRNSANGAYILNPNLKEEIKPPPLPSYIMHRPIRAIRKRAGVGGQTNDLVSRVSAKREKGIESAR